MSDNPHDDHDAKVRDIIDRAMLDISAVVADRFNSTCSRRELEAVRRVQGLLSFMPARAS